MSEVGVKITGDNAEYRSAVDGADARSKKWFAELRGMFGSLSDRGREAGQILGEVGTSFFKSFLAVDAVQRILGFFNSVIEKAERLRVLKMEFGDITDSIQLFDKMVLKAGGSLEQSQKIWERTKLGLSQLAEGGETATKNFATLGLSAADFIGLGLDDALEKIATAYQKNSDQAGAYAAIVEILGARNAPQLMAALRQLGTDGFDALREKNQNLSDTFKIQAADALSSVTRLFTEYTGRMKNLIGNVAGGFLEFGQILGGLGAATLNWLQGVKTDWDEVLLMNKKHLDALEKVKQAELDNGAARKAQIADLDAFQKKLDADAAKAKEARDKEEKARDKIIADRAVVQEGEIEKNKVLIAQARERAVAEASVLNEFEKQLLAIQQLGGAGQQGFHVGSDGTVSIAQLKQALDEAQRAFDIADSPQSMNRPEYGARLRAETASVLEQAKNNLQKAQMSVITADNATRIKADLLDFSSPFAAANAAFGERGANAGAAFDAAVGKDIRFATNATAVTVARIRAGLIKNGIINDDGSATITSDGGGPASTALSGVTETLGMTPFL